MAAAFQSGFVPSLASRAPAPPPTRNPSRCRDVPPDRLHPQESDRGRGRRALDPAVTGSRAREAALRGSADVVVIGGGLIGLAVADAIARRGMDVTIVSERRPGEASAAAAGMLAPTVEPLRGPALDFAIGAREWYPSWIRELEERSGVAVPLDRGGILELAHDDARAETLRAQTLAAPAPPTVRADMVHWLTSEEVRALEPALAPVVGAALHPFDGAVDNVVLLDALARTASGNARIAHVRGLAARMERAAHGVVVHLQGGERLHAPTLVLAAGAWSAGIAGLPRPLPIQPARGQMLSLGVDMLHHVVYAERAYLVPRGGARTLVGATMEYVGFDDSTTSEARQSLRLRATEVVPALRDAPVSSTWAGLRPMSPDGLPILGRDPAWAELIYAAGHSRNGILMAPLTGACVAALVSGEEPPADLSAFDVRRFGEPPSERASSGE